MGSSSTSVHICSLCVFLFLFLLVGVTIAAQQFQSFGFQRFDKSSNFESQFALFGDAKVGHGGSFLEITNSSHFSSGRVISREPILLSKMNSKGKVSFGTYFTFSLSPEAGDGLAFLMVSNGFDFKGFDGGNLGISSKMQEGRFRGFAIEFDTRMDVKNGDLNDNHVGLDVNSFVSVKVGNVSHPKLVLNSGRKLQCWIDYEATSHRIEVRLSKSGGMRPVDPLVSSPIDLSAVFKDEEVWFGLSSSSANSSQVCRVYSWSFKLRPVPYWMHSQPLDPEAFTKDAGPESETGPVHVKMHKKSDCILRVLTAVVVGTGCGAMGAFVVLLAWTLFSSRRQVMPEEFVSPKVEYDCDKVSVLVVDKPLKLKDSMK